MARRSREAVQKRLRERRRAEKAEQKRLKRLARKQGLLNDSEDEDVETVEENAAVTVPEGEVVTAEPEETP